MATSRTSLSPKNHHCHHSIDDSGSVLIIESAFISRLVDVEHVPHLAHGISLLFRLRGTRRSHTLFLLDECHERAPFAALAIAEPPRAHLQADPARVRALRPLAPLGGLTKRVAARGRNHVVVALFLSPGTNEIQTRE